MVSITAAPRTSARSGTLMALGSMSCVQLGLALSVHLFGQVGPLGAAWLRLAWAGLILAVWVRPRPGRFPRRVLLAAVGVLLLTRPWQGGADLAGTACALGAAGCWACYILLTQAVGDELSGV